MFLRRERVMRPVPLLNNREMKREARRALDGIGINIPRIDVAVARLSGGSARRSPSRALSTPLRTSSCSTSRSRRWGEGGCADP